MSEPSKRSSPMEPQYSLGFGVPQPMDGPANAHTHTIDEGSANDHHINESAYDAQNLNELAIQSLRMMPGFSEPMIPDLSPLQGPYTVLPNMIEATWPISMREQERPASAGSSATISSQQSDEIISANYTHQEADIDRANAHLLMNINSCRGTLVPVTLNPKTFRLVIVPKFDLKTMEIYDNKSSDYASSLNVFLLSRLGPIPYEMKDNMQIFILFHPQYHHSDIFEPPQRIFDLLAPEARWYLEHMFYALAEARQACAKYLELCREIKEHVSVLRLLFYGQPSEDAPWDADFIRLSNGLIKQLSSKPNKNIARALAEGLGYGYASQRDTVSRLLCGLKLFFKRWTCCVHAVKKMKALLTECFKNKERTNDGLKKMQKLIIHRRAIFVQEKTDYIQLRSETDFKSLLEFVKRSYERCPLEEKQKECRDRYMPDFLDFANRTSGFLVTLFDKLFEGFWKSDQNLKGIIGILPLSENNIWDLGYKNTLWVIECLAKKVEVDPDTVTARKRKFKKPPATTGRKRKQDEMDGGTATKS